MLPERDEIIAFLKKHISIERLRHCERVEAAALQLAGKFGADPARITAAALLHDVCREHSPDLLLQLAIKFDILVDDIQRAEPLLLHGSVGAALVESELGIRDQAVLEAIRHHITGASSIGALAQLIFVADFIEPGRTFEASRVLRLKAPEWEADQILLYVYNQTLRYVVERDYLAHPDTVMGRNELIRKGVKAH